MISACGGRTSSVSFADTFPGGEGKGDGGRGEKYVREMLTGIDNPY